MQGSPPPVVDWGSPEETGAVAEVAVGPVAGQSAARWWVALAIVVSLVAATVVGALLLTGSGAASRVAAWTPADSIVYAEARLDLPGDQRRHVGDLLGHFPGFEDRAILDEKIAETLDRIVRSASGGELDWTTEIDPWFDGQLAVFLTDSPAAGRPNAGFAATPSGAVLATVANADLAAAWLVDQLGEPSGTERLGEATINTIAGDSSGAWTIVDDLLIIGSPDAVRRAVGTGGRDGLATTADYRAARGAATADQVAFLYVDVSAVIAWAGDPAGEFGFLSPDSLPGELPGWTGASLRIEGDALITTFTAPSSDGSPVTRPTASRLLAHAPASTVFYVEARGHGASLLDLFEQTRAMGPEGEELADEIEAASRFLGGLDALLGWVGDTAFLATHDDGDLGAAILVSPTDAAAANRLLTSLRGVTALAGLPIREVDHAGTTIILIDLAPLVGLLGDDPLGSPPNDLELGFASTDDLVVIGLGRTSVAAVLDAGSGTSLADDRRATGILARAGGDATMDLFIDLRAIREILEEEGGPAAGGDAADYDRDLRPYLLPFDALAARTTRQSGIDRSVFVVTVD